MRGVIEDTEGFNYNLAQAVSSIVHRVCNGPGDPVQYW